jgi:hypothetical protein
MLARDYELIRQLDVYQDVGDAAFLEELQRHGQLRSQLEEQSHVPARR